MDEDKSIEMTPNIDGVCEIRIIVDRRLHRAIKQHAAFRYITQKQWMLEAFATKLDDEDSRQ